VGHTRRFVLPGFLALTITLVAIAGLGAHPTQALRRTTSATCAEAPTQLTNAGFEQPAIPGSNLITDQRNVPGWASTASDGKIELWKSGFYNVPAAEGNQFAELNTNMVSALYQDIHTTPGTVLTWGLSHRGRAGADTMRVLIGASGGDLVERSRFTDGNSAWGRHTGSYTVPPNQTCTRFQFEAVSAAGGPTMGNFLDAVSFGTPAHITASQAVSPDAGVSAGDTLAYRVHVTNDGGGATTNATATDAVPLHTTLVPGSIKLYIGDETIALPDTAFDATTRTITVQLRGTSGSAGVIEPGTSIVLGFDVVTDGASASTVLRNDATVTAVDGQGVIDTITLDPLFTEVAPNADVAVGASATTTAHPGDTVTYAIQVENNGPMPAYIGSGGEAAVRVTAAIPVGITVDASSLPSGCSTIGQSVTCDRMTTLPVRTSNPATAWAITFTAAVDLDAPLGMRTMSVTVTTQVRDAALGNNTASASTTVALPTPAQLNVVKTITTPSVHAGASASLVITVENQGELSTNAVTLTDSIPAGFTPTTVETNVGTCSVTTQISCALGIMIGGEIATISITGMTDATLADGTVLNDSAYATDGVTASGDTGAITVAAASQLIVTKGTTTPSPVAGLPLEYRVQVQNLGPSAARNAVIDDDLPAGTTLVTIPDGCTLTGNHLSCALGTLAANQTTTVTYSLITPAAGGTINNSATASSDSTPIQATQATDTATTDLAKRTDLVIVQQSSATTLISGDTVTLTFTVTNNGPSTATNVIVRNTPPNGLAYRTDGTDTVSPVGTNRLTPNNAAFWDIGTLAPGASAQATIRATLTGSPGGYPNSVTITGTDTDSNALNNSAVVSLVIPGPPAPTTTAPPGTPAESTSSSPSTTSSSSPTTSTAGTASTGEAAASTGKGQLPTTGSDAQPTLLVALTLILVGGVLIRVARRRHLG